MTLVVGLPRDERRTAALHLAAVAARSVGDELVVCAVVPTAWPPGLGRVDAEYQAYLDSSTQETLQAAAGELPPDLPATFVLHHARSAPAGLLEVAAERHARLICLGSSSAGPLGRVAFGSVAERLLHSSPIPVALAPRGFRSRAGARIHRVTAAFGATDGAQDFVVAAAGVAARVGASLRIASFAVRPRTIISAGVGPRAEEGIVAEWARDITRAQHEAAASISALPAVPSEVDTVIGYGRDWDEALEDVEWGDGDVLVVGSSAVGPAARVFLGSRASKIIRRSPVPVVVVPRGAVPELLARAERLPE